MYFWTFFPAKFAHNFTWTFCRHILWTSNQTSRIWRDNIFTMDIFHCALEQFPIWKNNWRHWPRKKNRMDWSALHHPPYYNKNYFDNMYYTMFWLPKTDKLKYKKYFHHYSAEIKAMPEQNIAKKKLPKFILFSPIGNASNLNIVTEI